MLTRPRANRLLIKLAVSPSKRQVTDRSHDSLVMVHVLAFQSRSALTSLSADPLPAWAPILLSYYHTTGLLFLVRRGHYESVNWRGRKFL